jgi:catechol 2,3-dioxygenase-like lactoylglutathione lyase family enzyme
MRTTVRLDEHLLSEVKKYAADSGRTLTSVLEDALRDMLARRTAQARRKPVRLRTYKGAGTQPGIDHLGFQCDTRAEIDRIAADAAHLGILDEPPCDCGGDIGYVTMVRDPDGHRVEFTHGQPLTGLA